LNYNVIGKKIYYKGEFAVASFLAYLPITWASALGGYLGRRKARKGIQKQRKWVTRLHHNLQQLEGINQHAAREKIIIKHLEHMGRISTEYPVVHRMANEGRLTIEGAHHLSHSDRPKLIISAHTGHWELLAEVMRQYKILTAYVYDPIENDLRLKVAMNARRRMCPERDGYKYIPASRSAGREVVNWLKDGGNLFIFGDEEVNSNILAPAFHRDIPHSGNLAKAIKLAKKYNMQIIPMHVKRTGNARYTAVIDAPLELMSDVDPKTQQERISVALDNMIENWVLEDISQWYWLAKLDLKR